MLALARAAMVEMIYHLQLNAALGPKLPFAGLQLDTPRTTAGSGAAFVLAVGADAPHFDVGRRRFAQAWGKAQEEIERSSGGRLHEA
jgi:branched-chain amino acid transport system permease protein